MFYLKGWDLLLFLKGPFCPRYNFSDSNSEIMLGTVRRTQILSTARKEYCTATIQISHHSLRKAENWNSRDDSVCQFIIRKGILLKYFIRTVQLAAAVHKSLFLVISSAIRTMKAVQVVLTPFVNRKTTKIAFTSVWDLKKVKLLESNLSLNNFRSVNKKKSITGPLIYIISITRNINSFSKILKVAITVSTSNFS